MENNNQLDNFLKEKMQDMHFEINEAHWKDAERRLDEKDDKKKPFFLLFLVGIILLGLGGAAFKKINSAKKNQPVAHNQYTDAKQQENIVQTNFEEDEIVNDFMEVSDDASTTKTGANYYNEATQNEPAVAEYNEARTQPTKNRTISNDVNNDNSSYATNEEIATETIVAQPKKNGIAPTRKEAKTKKSIASNPKASKKEVAKLPKSNPLASNKKEKVANKKLNKNTNPEIVKNTKEVISAVPQAAPKKKVAPKQIRIYKTPEDYQKLNPRYVDGLEGYTYTINNVKLTTKQSDSIRELVANQNKPAMAPAKTLQAPKVKKQFEKETSSFYLLAGMAAARGYLGNSADKAVYGLSPSLGLGYQYNMTSRMSMYLSLYMSYLNHINIKESRTNVKYSFDKDSTMISVTRKKIMQLHVPLQFAYKLSQKHAVFGGVGLNIGLNTVSLYEDSKLSGETRKFGYTSGLRFMDANASFGYEYNVSPQLSLGVFYQHGLSDMTKNDYFNNMQTDRNSRGGISLRYKFIR